MYDRTDNRTTWRRREAPLSFHRMKAHLEIAGTPTPVGTPHIDTRRGARNQPQREERQ